MSCLPGTPCFGGHQTVYPVGCGIDPCLQHKTSTDMVYYTGPNLPCIDVSTCTNMTTILQHIDNKLCGENLVQTIINTLINNTEIFNLFCTQVIQQCIDCDYVIDCATSGGCCGSSSTTTTTTQYPICDSCSTYQLSNTSNYETTVTYIDCSGNQPCWTEITIDAGQSLYICACDASISTGCDVTVSFVQQDCLIPCVCKTYALINSQFNFDVTFAFDDCDRNRVTAIVPKGGTPIIICACEDSLPSNPIVDVIEITDDCVDIPCIADCGVLFNASKGDDQQGSQLNPGVYYLNMTTQTPTQLFVPNVVGSYDIAHTNNKLWIYKENKPGEWHIYEYDITLCPFTAIFNKDVVIDPYELSRGLFAISDTELIAGSEGATHKFVKIDVSGVSPVITDLFTYPTEREVSGDILVTTDDKLIVTFIDTNDDDLYLSQYDFNTGTLEIDKNITNDVQNPWGLFEYNGGIYIGSAVTSISSQICSVNQNYPYKIEPLFTINTDINGASSVYSCTTESLSTTTTTTTVPACYCYNVDTTPFGEYTLEWLSCDGIGQMAIVNASTISFCAQEGTLGYTGVGDISVTGGTSSCTQNNECWQPIILDLVGVDKLNIRQISSTEPYIVDWGDGNQTSYPAGNNISSTPHVYSSPFTGEVKIKLSNPGAISIFRMDNGATYPSFTTGTVSMAGTEVAKMIGLVQMYNVASTGYKQMSLNADTSDFAATLSRLHSYNGTITGTLATLPPNLTQLNLTLNDTNSISGNISTFPSTLQYIVISGNNTLTGDVSGLPAAFETALTDFVIQGDNDISGDIVEFSTYAVLKRVVVYGTNTLTGDISNLGTPIMQDISITGYNDLSGDLSSLVGCTVLTRFQVDNDETDPFLPPGAGNTITGDITDIPNNVTTTIIGGKNTVTGNVGNIPTGGAATAKYFNVRGFAPGGNTISGDISATPIPANMKEFILTGNSNITGDIADIPTGMLEFIVDGTNTLYGNLGDTPSSLSRIEIRGSNTITTYNGKVWTTNMNNVSIVSDTDASSIMVQPDLDNLIIDLNLYTWPPAPPAESAPAINLRGNIGAGPAVTAALTSLTTVKGVTVTIIPFP